MLRRVDGESLTTLAECTDAGEDDKTALRKHVRLERGALERCIARSVVEVLKRDGRKRIVLECAKNSCVIQCLEDAVLKCAFLKWDVAH